MELTKNRGHHIFLTERLLPVLNDGLHEKGLLYLNYDLGHPLRRRRPGFLLMRWH